MAFSTQRAVSDGTLQDLLLEIEYIDKEDINVFISDVPQVLGSDYQWISNVLIRFTVPVPLDAEVLLQRATKLDNVLNIFTLGAVFDDPTMDENFRQMLYIAQEAREGSTLEEIFSNLNMHGYRVQNLGAGTEPGDAINFQQYTEDSLGAGNARAGAEAARDAAVLARNSAQAASASALASKDAAAASAAAALVSQGEAASSAATSTTQAGLSNAARVGSEAARDQAQAIADAIASNPVWLSRAIGEPFPLWDHIPGVPIPPTNDPAFRYVKLTASDPYNTGALTAASVTGTFPSVVATATVSDPTSPMVGQTLSLINTERRFLRAGSSGVTEVDTFQGHYHNALTANRFFNVSPGGGFQGFTTVPGETPVNDPSTVIAGRPYSDGTNGVPRVGVETRGKNVGASYYMRIR